LSLFKRKRNRQYNQYYKNDLPSLEIAWYTISEHKMTHPKISIVTPSYNQGEFLQRTILSVLNQNYPNIEYIIIDGGSTDNSIEIIKKYEKYLSYWVSEPDKGQADAINKGFSQATGDILAWLNSDDMYLPNAFNIAAETFMQNQNASIIYGDYIKVNAEDRCVALRRQPSYDYRTSLFGYLTVMQPASFFSRKLVFDVSMVDISYRYAMDYDLIIKLAQRGEVIHAREYLAAFRLHNQSKSVAEKDCFHNEYITVRTKNMTREPLLGELSLLHSYYKTKIFFRMLFENCLPSRLGLDSSLYKTGNYYHADSEILNNQK
jgi:glycosyltransferase involved in cell wall biosynthesis